MLKGVSGVPGEDGLDGVEDVLVGEGSVLAVVWPGDPESEFFPLLEPEGDLFDGGFFEIGGQGRLAGGGGGAGQDVTGGVGDAS